MKKNTIFDYVTNIMVIWSVSVLSLCAFCALFGEMAQGYSSIFQLGDKGLSLATLMQFFFLAAVITSLKWLFFTDSVIKNGNMLQRSILMFACVILSVALFAAKFQWFPVNQVKPWLMFFLCFFFCAAVSVTVSVLKEKSDNRKMQEALERLKENDKTERRRTV